MPDLSVSSASRMPDPASLLFQPKNESPEFAANWGAKQTLAQLRASIALGGVNLEATLQRIVDAAQLFTDANGAAIALQQDNWIVCRARTGEMAPDLKSRLDMSTGISGECLQSGEALCCHDAWADSRVDVEACGRLGLRSLAAVPIGEKPNVRGILETFSAQPHAFGENELSLLNELAELVTAAEQGSKPGAFRIGKREKLAGRALSFSKGKLIVAGVMVLAFVLWLALKKIPEHPNLSATEGMHPLNLQSSAATVDSSRVVLTSERLPFSHSNMKTSPQAGVMMASKIEDVGTSAPLITQPVLQAGFNRDRPALNVPPPRSQSLQPADQSMPVPPAIAMVSGSSDKTIAGLVSASTVLPQPAVRLSQGVSGGTLEYRVNPVYPNEAFMQRRQGRVTLNGVIAEDGRLQNLKVASGDPVLARAAMQAVSQWRYQPYKLNGEPIRRGTTINLIFKVP
jgi:TonB family protein